MLILVVSGEKGMCFSFSSLCLFVLSDFSFLASTQIAFVIKMFFKCSQQNSMFVFLIGNNNKWKGSELRHHLIFFFHPSFPKEIDVPGETFENSDNQNKENKNHL